MRYVGASVKRVEDPRLLTGRGRFVDDHRRAGMLHAHFVRSPLPHARVGAVGVAAAERAPGVALVLTGEHLAGLAAPLRPPESGGLRAPAHHALAMKSTTTRASSSPRSSCRK